MEFLASKPKIFGGRGDLLFLIYCVVGYAKYMNINFKKELETALSKVNKDAAMEFPHELSFRETGIKIEHTEKQVIEDLKTNNLAFEQKKTNGQFSRPNGFCLYSARMQCGF